MVDRRRLAPKLVDLILIGGMRIGLLRLVGEGNSGTPNRC